MQNPIELVWDCVLCGSWAYGKREKRRERRGRIELCGRHGAAGELLALMETGWRKRSQRAAGNAS
eukprot:10951371-Alexandrium_andersonii.AAC.1